MRQMFHYVTAIFSVKCIIMIQTKDNKGLMEYNIIILLSIIILILSVTVFIFYRKISKISFNSEIDKMNLNASVGGYYYQDVTNNTEYFSINLVSLFHLSRNIKTIKQFCINIGDSKKDILRNIEELKKQEIPQFSCNITTMVRGRPSDIYCVGTRMHKSNGELIGIVIWFYDMTSFNQQVDKILIKQKEEQKRANELEILSETLSFPVWVSDSKGKLIYKNSTYKKFTNFDADEEEQDLYKDMHEDIIQCVNKKESVKLTQQIIANGNRGIFDISILPAKKDGFAVGWAQDITERQKLDNEIKKYAAAYTDLLESSSSAMAMYGVNKQLQFYNHAFSKLWGLNEKWLDSKPTYGEVLEKLREKRKLPEQADFKAFRDQQLRWFQELSEPHNEFYYLPDGTELRVIVIPHALGGILFTYDNITDTLAMERSYNTLVAVQKETLDSLKEGIAVFSQSGRLELYNPSYEDLWPYEPNFLKQKPHISELIELSKDHIVFEESWQNFKNNLISEATHRKNKVRRLNFKDGKVVDVITIPLPDGKNLLSYVNMTDTILAERSLTERNLALEEADRVKTEFLANVSYELRTPLTTILGFSEVLEQEYIGSLSKEQRDYMHGIYDSANHLMSLINDILDLASIEAGYLSLDMKEFNIHEATSSIVDLLKTRIKDVGLTIKLTGNFEKSLIFGDERRIKQVIFNLLSNSIKFTNEGGNISISIKNTKNFVSVTIKDTGIGIAEEEIPYIFERFYKTKIAQHLEKTGTGLGLSLVKNMINMHNGTIDIKSEIGVGTEITCKLPRNQELL